MVRRKYRGRPEVDKTSTGESQMNDETQTINLKSDLYILENMRLSMQKERIQLGNRLDAINRGVTQIEPAHITYLFSKVKEIEDYLTETIAEEVQFHEMWDWMSAVKGIGPGLAASLLAYLDIERAPTVSSLWKYCGQGVTDGQRDRPRKGEKLSYNAKAKRVCYLIATSFLRAGSPYRDEYDVAKAYYTENRDWRPAHVDMASRRKMIKMFLSHMWVVWRYERELEARKPYAMTVLGHDGMKYPWDYVPDYNYTDKLKEMAGL
jgi:hypothetical protein